MELIVDAFQYLRQGGLVMIPLAITSIWMWALILERALYFRGLERDDINPEQVVEVLGYKALPERSKGIRAHLTASFLAERTGNPRVDKGILKLCAMRERARLKHSLAVIAVLAAAAPLLGLLGTVTGMISTFDVLARFGMGNAKAVAGGISQALITTQTGLVVAIPGLF